MHVGEHNNLRLPRSQSRILKDGFKIGNPFTQIHRHSQLSRLKKRTKNMLESYRMRLIELTILKRSHRALDQKVLWGKIATKYLATQQGIHLISLDWTLLMYGYLMIDFIVPYKKQFKLLISTKRKLGKITLILVRVEADCQPLTHLSKVLEI